MKRNPEVKDSWITVTVECVDRQTRTLDALIWRERDSAVGHCQVWFSKADGDYRDFCCRSGVMLPVQGRDLALQSKSHGARNWRLSEQSLRDVRELLGFLGNTQHWQWPHLQKPKKPDPRPGKPPDPRQTGFGW